MFTIFGLLRAPSQMMMNEHDDLVDFLFFIFGTFHFSAKDPVLWKANEDIWTTLLHESLIHC